MLGLSRVCEMHVGTFDFKHVKVILMFRCTCPPPISSHSHTYTQSRRLAIPWSTDYFTALSSCPGGLMGDGAICPPGRCPYLRVELLPNRDLHAEDHWVISRASHLSGVWSLPSSSDKKVLWSVCTRRILLNRLKTPEDCKCLQR